MIARFQVHALFNSDFHGEDVLVGDSGQYLVLDPKGSGRGQRGSTPSCICKHLAEIRNSPLPGPILAPVTEPGRTIYGDTLFCFLLFLSLFLSHRLARPLRLCLTSWKLVNFEIKQQADQVVV